MPNMPYCRFQNTGYDLEDCLEALEQEKEMSTDEKHACKEMFCSFLEYCREAGIIEDFDLEPLECQLGL